ncbi:MAG: protein-L-isoaspartate O-methyltransferase family protein [Clostridia bacterium]
MSKKMLIESLRKKGFSEKILKAFNEVKRENFIEGPMKRFAYRDRPLPIGENATISQPFTIAFMLDLLDLEDNMKILEIGSGCGYVLALINNITEKSKIYGVEISSDLAEKSENYLSDTSVRIFNKDGYDGLKEKEPFDRILVSAAYEEEPLHLLDQLKSEGILVVPVNNSIIKYTKNRDKVMKERHFGFAFVTMQRNY